MKEKNTIKASTARSAIVITLATLTMFVVGYFVGQGLYQLFS